MYFAKNMRRDFELQSSAYFWTKKPLFVCMCVCVCVGGGVIINGSFFFAYSMLENVK